MDEEDDVCVKTEMCSNLVVWNDIDWKELDNTIILKGTKVSKQIKDTNIFEEAK